MTLFVTDAEIIERLGVSEKTGYRAIHELERQRGRRPFPKKDPLFGDKRFWPAVYEWLCDYYGVRQPAQPAVEITTTHRWEENFDAPAPARQQAEGIKHARPRLAPA